MRWKPAALSVSVILPLCFTVVLWLVGMQMGVLKSQGGSVNKARSLMLQKLILASGSCRCSVEHYWLQRLDPLDIKCQCPSHNSTTKQEPLQETMKQPVQAPCPEEGPWYAQGRTWHYPVRFPRCSMDVCFNYSRCDNMQEPLIYIYNQPSAPVRYFSRIRKTRWHTPDPKKACLFFVFFDVPGIFRPELHPSELPYWNGGLNHVLITFADMWDQKGPPADSIGFASILASDMHETTSRPSFDISIALPGNHNFTELQKTKPYARKYLLTFRGLRYVKANMTGEGIFRSHATFRGMHNGKDVIVATSCKHPVNDEHRRTDPKLGAHCEEDEANYELYNYKDLMNSTFGLVPAGISPSSYRFAEVLSAGTVPVVIADNYVKPFDTLVQWHRCILQFPTTEMHRIVATVRAMKRKDVEKRQIYCMQIYKGIFRDDETLLRATVEALKVRFMGAFPRMQT